MNTKVFLAVTALTAGSLVFTGCDKDRTARTTEETPSARTAGERVGDAMDRGLDRTGEAVDQGARRTGDAARDTGHAADNAARDSGRAIDNAADRSGNALGNAADRVGQALTPGDKDVRALFASTTEAALTKDGLKYVTKRLAEADRDRVDNYTKQDHSEYDAVVDSLQREWKSKYNQDFKIKNPENVFNDVTIDRTGDRATATVKTAEGNVDLKLVNDSGWKIDVPDTMSGRDLEQKLSKALTQVRESSSDWPADVDQAQQYVAYHVLSAFK